MGLELSHSDTFKVGYSEFGRWRQAIVQITGGAYGYDERSDAVRGATCGWHFGPGYSEATHPGLYALLCGDDCGGQSFSPQECEQIANELTALLPALEQLDAENEDAEDGDDLLSDVAEEFIDACRAAASQGEALEFC